MTKNLDKILTLQPALLNWGEHREEVSVFPILDSVFETLADISARGESLSPSLQKLGALNPAYLQSADLYRQSLSAFLTHRDIWRKILGAEGSTRILFLNQNSDELRAGGGFPGTVFVMEWDQ